MNRCAECGKELMYTNEVTLCTSCQNKPHPTMTILPDSWNLPDELIINGQKYVKVGGTNTGNGQKYIQIENKGD